LLVGSEGAFAKHDDSGMKVGACGEVEVVLGVDRHDRDQWGYAPVMGERRGLTWARLTRRPAWAASAPDETRAVVTFCVGKTFRVTATNAVGQVGLDVSPDVDRKFGGFMNELWVEPEHLEPDGPRLNQAKGRPAFGDAFHLLRGASTFGRFRHLGAKHLLGSEDSLSTGPSSPHPKHQPLLRQAFWRNFYRSLPRPTGVRPPRYSPTKGMINSLADLEERLRKRPAGQPIVMWCGADWDDLLFVWWSCDALTRSKVSPRDLWLASAAAEFNRHAARELTSLDQAGDDDILRMFTFSRRCTAPVLSWGACLWAAFAAGDLGAIQAFRDGPRSAPPLGPLPVSAATLVPRVRPGGRSHRLRLSAYDHRLLGLFSSGAWTTAMGRLEHAAQRQSFMKLIDAYGGALVAARLAAWAAHAPAVLESRIRLEAKSFLDAVEYRLTSMGMALLKHGLQDLAVAPPLAVGGFIAGA
jgi:hypothetical protein